MSKKITPFLWFDKDMSKIITYYKAIFPDLKTSYGNTLSDTPSGEVETATMEIFGQELNLMTAGPGFKFNEAVSFALACEDQQEVDYYWNAFKKEGEESNCGWIKDKYGLFWQVIPKQLVEMMSDKDRQKAGRATQAMLKMRKIDVAIMKKAFDGE